jgi:starch phosphorylase
VDTQELVDDAYRDRESWLAKSVINAASMARFSSDRSIREYASRIWELDAIGSG